MKRNALLCFGVLAMGLAAPRLVLAQDCSHAPQGFSGDWARTYAAWCQSCCGTVTGAGSGIGCSPGPNWGNPGNCNGSSSSGPSSGNSGAAAAAQQAEQDAALIRQKEAQERADKEAAEAEARKKKFQETQQETASQIRGVNFDQSDIRVSGQGDVPLDSSVVDLRHLDPDRPIYVDPNVVKGKPRVFPAQAPLQTLNNANYQKGFDALKAGTPLVALSYFNQAQKELPDDLLVHHAMGLTKDIIRVRRERAEEAIQRRATEEAANAYYAFLGGDDSTALACINRANGLDPTNQPIADAAHFMMLWAQGQQGKAGAQGPQQKALLEKAHKIAGSCYLPVVRGDYAGAQRVLKAALALAPNDPNIRACLHMIEGFDLAQKEREKAMQPLR